MFPIGPLRFDPCSLVLILLLSALLAYGTEASNMFNIGKLSYLCFRLCNSTPTKSMTEQLSKRETRDVLSCLHCLV